MVLDAALDPAVSGEQLSRGQLRGFQRATDAFINDCLERRGLRDRPDASEAEQQLTDLARRPSTGAHCRPSPDGR